MAVVGAWSPVSFKVTCIETDLEKSKVNRVVVQLLNKGLLKKQEDRADQRSFYLTLTPSGKKLYKAMYADAIARNEQWLAVLPCAAQKATSPIPRIPGSADSAFAKTSERRKKG